MFANSCEISVTDGANFELRETVVGIITQRDLLDYLTTAENLVNDVEKLKL